MSKSKSRCSPNPNSEVRLAIARWKIETGGTQNELAERLGVKPCNLSRAINGGRSGAAYIPKIYQFIDPRRVS